MKLSKITSIQLKSHFDQTADWLNRLNGKVEQLEQRIAQLEQG